MLTVRLCHSAHDDQPRSLHNNIYFLSKTIFLSGSKSYILVKHFIEAMPLSAHSEAMPSRSHNNQYISLYKYII